MPTVGVILLRGSEVRLGAWQSSRHLRGLHWTWAALSWGVGQSWLQLGTAETQHRVGVRMCPPDDMPRSHFRKMSTRGCSEHAVLPAGCLGPGAPAWALQAGAPQLCTFPAGLEETGQGQSCRREQGPQAQAWLGGGRDQPVSPPVPCWHLHTLSRSGWEQVGKGHFP